MTLPSVVGRPEMLGIMAGTYQKDIYAVLVDSGSRMYKGGFTGCSVPRAVFLSLSSGPRCSAFWPMWIRRTVSLHGHQHPCRGAKAFPMVQTVLRTIENPLFLLKKVVDAQVVQVSQGVYRVVDAPGMQVVVAVVAQRPLPMIQTVLVDKGRCPCDAHGHHDRCSCPDGAGGCRRPLDHAAHVPAVLRVPGASGSVPRQSVGHSTYATETDTLCSPWVGCYAPVVAQRQALLWSSFLCPAATSSQQFVTNRAENSYFSAGAVLGQGA